MAELSGREASVLSEVFAISDCLVIICFIGGGGGGGNGDVES